MSDSRKLFEGPPILPWHRVDTKKPITAQLSKARVLKGVTLRTGGPRGTLKFPDLRVVKPPAAKRDGPPRK